MDDVQATECGPQRADYSYDGWVRRYDTLSDEDRRLIRDHIDRLPSHPLISVVMPAYQTPETLLRQAITSIRNQLYPHWELCIADDGSPSPHVAAVLADEAANDPRIRWVRRATNGHISAATNTALDLATGPFVALMDHDDVMPEHALYEVAVELAAHPDADLIYSDEDHIDLHGHRSNPYFKPAWSPELLAGHNVISHLGVYRRSLVEALGRLRIGYEGSQDWDLALRVTASTTPDKIRHIPAILYHWRWDSSAPSFSQSWLEQCQNAGRRAVEDWLKSEGLADSQVTRARLTPGWSQVIYARPDPVPLVSIIVTAREGFEPDALLAATDWPMDRLELIIVGPHTPTQEIRPGVRATTIPANGSSSHLLNIGVAAARGDLLILLSGDLQPSGQQWLSQLAGLAWRYEVGVVGAKLVDEQGWLQHCGVVLHGGRAFCLGQTWWNQAGYGGQYALARGVAAVAGGCLGMRRAVFEEAGGLDEALTSMQAEVQLCMRVRDMGFRVVWTPESVLRYRSGATSRPERDVDLDMAHFITDPYHNPNLRLDPSELSIPAPPRRTPPWRQRIFARLQQPHHSDETAF
jgi:GT2 family glycosyltransferase